MEAQLIPAPSLLTANIRTDLHHRCSVDLLCIVPLNAQILRMYWLENGSHPFILPVPFNYQLVVFPLALFTPPQSPVIERFVLFGLSGPSLVLLSASYVPSVICKDQKIAGYI